MFYGGDYVAENLLSKKGWYPPFENDSDYANSTYVYSPTLKDVRPSIYKKASKLMKKSLNSLDNDLKPSLDELYRLAKREKKKEDEFLNKKCKIARSSARTDGERIKDFNRLYQRIEIFERNIKKIESVNKDTKSLKIDITSVFRYYLAEEIEELSLEDMNYESIKKAVERAIIKAFSSQDFTGAQDEETHSYAELLRDL